MHKVVVVWPDGHFMSGILCSIMGDLFYHLFYFVTTSFVCLLLVLLPVFVPFLSFAIGCSVVMCYTCVQSPFPPLCIFSVCAHTCLSHSICCSTVKIQFLHWFCSCFSSVKLLFIALLSFGIFDYCFVGHPFLLNHFSHWFLFVVFIWIKVFFKCMNSMSCLWDISILLHCFTCTSPLKSNTHWPDSFPGGKKPFIDIFNNMDQIHSQEFEYVGFLTSSWHHVSMERPWACWGVHSWLMTCSNSRMEMW